MYGHKQFVPLLAAAGLLAGTFAGVVATARDASASTILVSTTKRSSDRGALLSVDPATGARTVVGDPTAGTEGLTSLERDAGGKLWGTTIDGQETASRLYRIDSATGAFLQDVGFVHTNPGDAAGSSLSLGDLAYDPTSGTMYGVTANTKAPYVGGELYTIDTGTGLASLVGQIMIDNPDDAGPAFAHDYSTGGLAFRADGTLWFTGYDPTVNPEDGGQNFLFEIDPDTAVEISRTELSRNVTIFHGLGVRPEDQVFFATEANNPFVEGDGGLYTIATDGTVTLVSADTLDGNTLSDVVFIAEPGTLAAMAAGLIGLALARRRAASQPRSETACSTS